MNQKNPLKVRRVTEPDFVSTEPNYNKCDVPIKHNIIDYYRCIERCLQYKNVDPVSMLTTSGHSVHRPIPLNSISSVANDPAVSELCSESKGVALALASAAVFLRGQYGHVSSRCKR